MKALGFIGLFLMINLPIQAFAKAQELPFKETHFKVEKIKGMKPMSTNLEKLYKGVEVKEEKTYLSKWQEGLRSKLSKL